MQRAIASCLAAAALALAGCVREQAPIVLPPGGGHGSNLATAGVSLNEDLTARQVFPPTNWWNLDVSNAPLDTASQTFINFINNRTPQNPGNTRYMHPDFGPPPYGMPYVTVSGTQPLLPVTFAPYGAQSDAGAAGRPPGYPIPDECRLQANYIEGGIAGGGSSGDRHMLIIDRDHWLLFETWATKWNSALSRWEAGSGATFNLATNDRRTEGWTSADAAGLAIFPGLIRWDEVNGPNEIHHAFRFTVRATNGYVWPASHVAGSQAGAPPMGLRLRMKSSVNITGFPPMVQKIFRAMKKYGVIVADNGSDLYMQGTMDTHWDNDILNPAFHSVPADDFEVVVRGWNPTPASVP